MIADRPQETAALDVSEETAQALAGWPNTLQRSTQPPLTMTAGAGGQLGLSLVAGGDGVVHVKLETDRTYTTRVDSSSPPPTPPYSLSFHDAGAEPGCALVWLEIPFPFEPKS